MTKDEFIRLFYFSKKDALDVLKRKIIPQYDDGYHMTEYSEALRMAAEALEREIENV